MIVRYIPADPAGNLTAIVLSPVAPQAGRGKENRTVKAKTAKQRISVRRFICVKKIFTGATKRALPIVYTGETRRKQKKPLGGRAG